MYILQSSVDNKTFEVDKTVMNSSSLLKNLCGLTSITEPIKVECSSQCLERFVQIVQKKDNDCLTNMSDQMLVEICNEMCILDSDVILNSIAEEILHRFRKFKWDKIMEYFGLEDDFSADERKLIENRDRVEFCISMDTDEMKFPFPGTNFSSMPNKFYTPLNALLARVIQLSQGFTAFELSKINKAMKNESDRYPIKLLRFLVGSKWWLKIGTTFIIDKQKYFDHIKKRKVIAENGVSYSNNSKYQDFYAVQSSSLNFVIPTNSAPAEISFHGDEQAIYAFNVKECPFSLIKYSFTSMPYNEHINFDKVYEHLVAKDITKKIEIFSSNAFLEDGFIRMYKKTNELKFHEVRMEGILDEPLSSEFMDFVKKYMIDDGIIFSTKKLLDFPHSINRNNKDAFEHYRHRYLASIFKQDAQISKKI